MQKHPNRLGRGLDSLIPHRENPTNRQGDSGSGTSKEHAQTEPRRTVGRQLVDSKVSDGVGTSDPPRLDSLHAAMRNDDEAAPKKAYGIHRQTSVRGESPLQSQQGFRNSMADSRIVDIDALRPNANQPRQEMNDERLRELAASITKSGVVQPIVSRETETGLEIIAGERRWRAARMAGLKRVPVLVRDATDKDMIELALIENIHREDLNAVDRAEAYRRFCNVFQLTAEAVAMRTGEDRTTVTNYLRLLELPKVVRTMLVNEKISMGHARCLLALQSKIRQIELADDVAKRQLSVRALEGVVRREKRKEIDPSNTVKPKNRVPVAHTRELERRLEEALQTKVRIQTGRTKGSGRIMIDFFDVNDFERIASRLGISNTHLDE